VPPLFFFVAGCLVGWLAGRSSDKTAQTLHRGTADVLDGIGRLAHAGALGNMEGMQLSSGGAKQGVHLAIQARGASSASAALPDSEDLGLG